MAPAVTASAPVRWTLLLASSLTVLAGAIIAPALPSVREAFSDVAGVETLARLVLTVPALAMALGSPFAGVIADRVGRVPLLASALVLYAFAGTTGLYVDSLTLVLAGRAALGFAMAGAMTAANALIADVFPPDERRGFLALQAAFMGAGGLVFLVAGGALADVSWRAPFAIYAVSLLLLPTTLRALPRRDPSASVATDAKERVPWATVSFLYGVSFLSTAIFYVLPVQMPFLLRDEMHVSGALVGLAIASMTMTSSPVALLYPKIVARTGFVGCFALSFAVMAPGYVAIGLAPSYPVVIAGALVAGLGLGLLMPNSNTWGAQLAPAHARGRVLGALNAALFLGMFLSPVLTKPVVDVWGLSGLFGAFGASGIACAVLALLLVVGRALKRG
jgi:MFS family permease